MATRSMHKPGWRSRRRSRLSLVERAVPRLGRVMKSKDGSKSTSAKKQSAEASPSNDITTLSELEPRQIHVETKAHDAEVVTDISTAIDASPADEAVNERVHADAEPVEAATPIPDTVSEQHADPKDVHPIEESAPAATDEAQPKSDLVTSDRHADEKDEPAATERSPEPMPDTQAPPEPPVDVVEPVIDRPAAVTESPAFASEAAQPARRTGADLDLDWAHLIASGFTDPRDRTLPHNMTPIIRALVRQALSDQSSWRDRIILVTSPYERLSKSTAAINFAFGLTTVDGHRAVLVDADSTGQGAVDHLGGHDRIGITDALSDESLDVDDLVIGTDLERLTLVSSGAPDSDLVDHLASRRMLRVLRHLTESPETILVIDAPPILVSQEASVLSVIAGQVVLAVEAGKTTADQIEHALQRLGDRHNVSLVLNESSGLQHDQGPSTFGQNQPAKVNRRAISVGRHLPKAATAAAGALAIGLFVQQFQAEALASRALALQAQSLSTQLVVKPERWSRPADITSHPCHQMCR
ncbi:MAG: hypothetical protein ACR2RE_20805 [Geminicoccaceae bacterium]